MIGPFRRYLLDRMVLRPSRQPIEFAPQQRVMLSTSSGRSLECFVQKNFDADEPAELLVLKFPGTAGRAERSTGFPMSIFRDTRVAVWTWNPPGYGRSDGRACLARIADAAIDFWTQVTARQCDDSTNVWFCGNSLGCVLTLHVAASVQPDPSTSGIIMRNPPPLIPVVKNIARQYPLGRWMDPVVETLCDAMNAMLSAPRVNLPAVFLQSELDTVVTRLHQNELIDAYAGPRRVVLMEGLSHSDVATEIHEPLIRESLEWLWTQSGCKTDEPSSAS